MNYKIVTIESIDELFEHVMIEREDGSFESFSVDENNPRYIQFLAELEENK